MQPGSHALALRIPIPHLQWATTQDLARQLEYAQAQGFHTLTLNLQMWKRQGWDTVAAGISIIRELAPQLRLLITGVAGLKRLAELGWVFLHGGKAGDRQVVPQAWVEQVASGSDAVYTSRADHAYYYQDYWWLDVENDAYYAEGNLCQFIYVYPAADLVLVRHGRDCGGTYWTGLLGDIAQWLEPRLAD